jgi:hypothetical protein
MLIIRKEQKVALREVPLAVFKERMFVHLQKYFPEDCKILGDSQLKQVIDFGIAGAESHGFQSSGDACRYLSLMFLFGSYFDQDPQIPWAEELLKDRNIVSPHTRMDLLCDRAGKCLDRISGPSGEYYKRALLKLRGRSFDDVTKTDARDLNAAISSFLKSIYPQKYQEMDEEKAAAMAKLAESQADTYGMNTREGVLVYAGFMFLLGSHFDRDLLYPWAAAVLKDSSIAGSDFKARKLHKQAIYILEQFIAVNGSIGSA